MSVSRSCIPGNRFAVDKTTEETFMKHAKSHSGAGGSGAGASGLTSNINLYQKWVRSSHERAKFVEAAFQMADMLNDTGTGKNHREICLAEMLKGDDEVIEIRMLFMVLFTLLMLMIKTDYTAFPQVLWFHLRMIYLWLRYVTHRQKMHLCPNG
ncbi:hypothetical protein DPMN_180087 [Dreissena polymorpha]|uniref:Uncharacterized protein n=1 Tax=Dreissena polymorpha TaxID=45954 RepID=A0A9D4EG03_DREPO|nr:hypothetical protein DPMN_180087 [Dreissena polymorpha]